MTESKDNQNPQYFMPEIYKQWHKRGFLSVRYWPHAEKVQVEIGTIDPNSYKTLSVSKCFIGAYEFLTYTHAETYNQIDRIFPDFATKDWQVFRGNVGEDGPISRVFTAGYWKPNKDAAPDPTRRSFRCANYVGKPTNSGAMMPIYDKPISFNMIQMTFAQIAELHHRLNVFVNAYALQKTDLVDIYESNSDHG